MKQKTFMDSDFYQKAFCNKKELMDHWGIKKEKLAELEKAGVVSQVENFGTYYSVKQIIQVENLGVEDIREMDFRRTIKERDELKERCEKLENILAKFRNLAVMEVV